MHRMSKRVSSSSFSDPSTLSLPLEDDEIKKFTNKLIKKITENLENFSYNKIVANIYEMHTFVSKQIKNN